ncbi:MAG: UDP-glucose 4-epimerase GalE [Patescibacteria group bacterium]|nr:UDP-glucose 4-epimerase GalE [Patescibacteria group bacterium]
MEKKILITGCAGYIGSVASDLFLSNGYRVIGVDNLQTGYRQAVEFISQRHPQRFFFYQQDLKEDLASIFEENQPIALVVHYAASCVVDESMRDPHKYFYNNAFGTLNLLETMRKFQTRKIVFSSTCAVYGEAETVPVSEKHQLLPVNPYGQSKKMAEEIIQWYGQIFDFDFFILRYFNVCGASDDGTIGDSKKPSTLLVQNAVRGALRIESFYLTCPQVDTPDKTPIRDYINVVDLNEAHLLAAEKLLESHYREVVNLGTGQGNSVLEIVSRVQEITGRTFKINRGRPRKGEYARIFADITKAKRVLGWQPRRTIDDSIKTLVKWYTHHPQGWDY